MEGAFALTERTGLAEGAGTSGMTFETIVTTTHRPRKTRSIRGSEASMGDKNSQVPTPWTSVEIIMAGLTAALLRVKPISLPTVSYFMFSRLKKGLCT